MLIFRSSNKFIFNKTLRYCSFSNAKTPIKDKIIIYGDEISPPVRFVTMTASILGIDLDFRKIDLFRNENRTDFYKEINLLQKVPTMVVGDIRICDSHAISLYLCQVGNGSKLYLEDPLLRAKVNQMLFFNCSTLFRIDSEILSAYFSQQWPVHEIKINEWLMALDYLEYQLNRNIWLTGNKMQLCDLCIVPVVTSMLLILPLTEKHPKIGQWIKKFEDYTFYDINKRGLVALNNYIEIMKNVYN